MLSSSLINHTAKEIEVIRQRNILGQFIVYILTLGLYGIYWYYSTLEEMTRYRGERAESLLWTIGTIIPIINLFAWWKHASTVDKLTTGKYPTFLMWLLGVFFTPAYWIVVQLELNNMAGTPPEETASP